MKPLLIPIFAVTLMICVVLLPAFAHEGSSGQHLMLGLDAGFILGTAIGFGAGVFGTIAWMKRSKAD